MASTKRRGMGRGLEAILSVSAPPAGGREEELRELPLDAIRPNPKQPRRRFDEESLNALAGSLGDRGVLQPVLVRPLPDGAYELVAGERRWRAAQLAGLERIPALVRARADTEALEVALVENMAREDLNPVEEARACAALVEELGLTREEVGRRVGRGRVAVTNLIRLLDLPDEALDLLERGTFSEGHGRALLLAKDHAARRSLARSAAAEGWSVRVVEDRARANNEATASEPGRSRATKGRAGGAGGAAGRAAAAHPDQEAAAAEIEAALEAALGAEVRARPAGEWGYRVELAFGSAEEALELARRVGG